jgi:hypothetical protein
MNEEYLRLLASFELALSLEQRSGLLEPALATKILTLSGGTIGEISTLLSHAALMAIERGRINVEYAGRKPGESYTVVPALFNLCMARRAHDSRFRIPIPPPPLAHDANAGIVLRPFSSEVALAS